MISEKIDCLIIEDDEVSSEILKSMIARIENLEVGVSVCGTLNDGITHLNSSDVDIVLLDLGLPDSKGLDTIKALAENSPSIPIVVVSATSEKDAILDTMQYGAQDYLIKGDFRGTDVERSMKYSIQRKMTENNLLISERRLALHIEQTPLGVIEWDKSCKILKWNPAAERIFGYTKEEAIGRNLIDLIVLDDEREKAGKFVEYLFSDGPGGRLVNNNKHKSGLEINCEWYNTPLVDGKENVIGVASLVQDITERVKAKVAKDELQQELFQSAKLASLGKLSSGIAHEINNPLTIIMGNINLLKMAGKVPPTLESDFDSIERAGMRIQEIVSGLRSCSRSASDVIDAMDVHELITDAVHLVRAIYAKDNVKIKLDFKSQVPFIKGNIGSFQQAIMSLLTNAKESMSDKGGVIKISTELQKSYSEEIEDVVVIKIKDEGRGISPENLNKIFDVFYTTKTFGEGPGLGLSIVHAIVSSMSGKIEIDSHLDHGTAVAMSFESCSSCLYKDQ